MKTIALVSLGCAKNLVDSEMILGMFRSGDYRFSNNPKEADVIIVNTCGFIESAKREAIDTILDMARYDAKLVAVGCFVERNLDELKAEIPEVDLWVPIRDYPNLHKRIDELLNESDVAPINPLQRVVSTGDYSAYLRISDGCNNFCAFCAIPYIRGIMKSRPFDEIIKEAKILKEKGIKEISVISQDPMHYGADFKGKKPDVLDLMKALDEMGFYSVRMLYLYPEEVTEEQLQFIANSKTIEHYFDVPIQCASNHVLKLMNRHGTKEDMLALFKRIKELMPEAVLRTTLISGFPGETEEDHKETLEFIEEIGFDKLGDFIYSREEGTRAFNLPDQVDEKIKKKRHDEIMKAQRKISYRLNKAQVGKIMKGMVVGYDNRTGDYLLRSYWNAPDDVDGNIYFTSKRSLKEGDIVSVKITDSLVYDLLGEEVVNS